MRISTGFWRTASAVCASAVVFAGAAEPAPKKAAAKDRYMQLGVGCYFGGVGGRVTELDAARFDWLYLCFGNIGADEKTVALLNRLLAVNPRLKIVIRVWPIMGAGTCPENRYQATMYDYFYRTGVKERVLAETRRQIRIVLEGVTKPENVVGMTFLEELPGHFTDSALDAASAGRPAWGIEKYRKEIESETGAPFAWNDRTRRWWCAKYVEAINEIHAEMKKAGEGRLVFYYQQTNHFNLDHAAAGAPTDTPQLIPFRLAEIIRPGLCDGFFAYPNNTHIWETRTLRFAREKGWLFFSQLPHPSGMRLGAWDEVVRLAKTKVPQNLGYFWYCEGRCAGNIWNDDPAVGPDERVSHYVEHTRRFLAREKVGMGILDANLKPAMAFDYRISGAKKGDFSPVWVEIRNVRDASWYADGRGAVLRNARIRLAVPSGVELPESNSPPAEIPLGDIEAGGCRAVLWWARMKESVTVSAERPMEAVLTADNCPRTAVRSAEADATPAGWSPRAFARSGESWVEPVYRGAGAGKPVRFTVTPLTEPVFRPSLSDGRRTVLYDGTVHVGESLVADGAGARIVPADLVVGDPAVLRDAADPSGAKKWTAGYGVTALALRSPTRPAAKVRVTISGKVEGGAASQVLLNGVRGKNERWSEAILVNALGGAWRENVAQEVAVPAGVRLTNVALYRRNNQGAVWYGAVSVKIAGIPEGGADAGERMMGSLPVVEHGTFQRFTYADGVGPAASARVMVGVAREEGGDGTE